MIIMILQIDLISFMFFQELCILFVSFVISNQIYCSFLSFFCIIMILKYLSKQFLFSTVIDFSFLSSRLKVHKQC